MSDRTAVLEQLRKPEYTGDNRCLPCTVVNVAIALLASVLVAVALAVELAAAVFAVALVVVYFRGYLVPGTPTLTERYLPDRILERFDAHPASESRSEEMTFETIEKIERRRENAVDPETFLRDVGAIRPDEDGEEFRLREAFAERVERGARRHRDDPLDREALAAMFETDPGEVTFEDRPYPAFKIDRRIRKWPSEAALLADVATHEALEATTDRWLDVPLEQRLEILETLRSLAERCPACSGAVRLDDDVVESCCVSYEVVTLGCADCGARLLEFAPEAIESGADYKGIQP